MDKLLQMQETLLKDNRQWTSVKDKHVESMKVKINFVLAFPSFMNVPILFKYLKKKNIFISKDFICKSFKKCPSYPILFLSLMINNTFQVPVCDF
jgi:hypothetical protein